MWQGNWSDKFWTGYVEIFLLIWMQLTCARKKVDSLYRIFLRCRAAHAVSMLVVKVSTSTLCWSTFSKRRTICVHLAHTHHNNKVQHKVQTEARNGYWQSTTRWLQKGMASTLQFLFNNMFTCKYHTKAEAILEFLQRAFYKINPDDSTKRTAGFRKGRKGNMVKKKM